jgi:hypothetical protein
MSIAFGIWTVLGLLAILIEIKFGNYSEITLTDVILCSIAIPLLGGFLLYCVLELHGKEVILWRRK